MHIVILCINCLPITNHIHILFTYNKFACIIEFRMWISKTQWILCHMCISTASLFYFQIRIYNKCPAKISCTIINQMRKSSHRIISFFQPAFFTCQQISIIGSVTTPAAPTVRRVEHVRQHLHVILCFPITHGSTPPAGIGDSQLGKTIMTLQNL